MPAFRTVAVIGAGALGRGIAHALALGGLDVVLEDVLPTTLTKAGSEIRELLDLAVAAGTVTTEAADTAFRRISYAGTVEQAVRQAEVAIEAVPDEIESKLEIMTLLDRVAKPDTVLVSSTAFVMVTETASITFRPQNCVGMHFEKPVQGMDWIEIIPGEQTGASALATAVELARRMQLRPVVTREVPGLIARRIRALVMNEAFLLLGQGVASAEDIDDALRLEHRAGEGPLRTADRIGLDHLLQTLMYLHRTLGERYRPAPELQEYVRAGRLGVKTGRGVFVHPGSCDRQPASDVAGVTSSPSV